MLRRTDLEAAKFALENKGFVRFSVLDVHCFLDGPEANPRDAVHIVFANEKVKPKDLEFTADVCESGK